MIVLTQGILESIVAFDFLKSRERKCKLEPISGVYWIVCGFISWGESLSVVILSLYVLFDVVD